ncbi:405_t:CDS:1, partial [Funneliformis caledonium]
GQRLTSFLITSAQNSFSLSDCKIVGDELIEKNKLNKKAATSIAYLK